MRMRMMMGNYDHGDDDDAGGDADDGDVSYVEDDGAHADVDDEDDVTL